MIAPIGLSQTYAVPLHARAAKQCIEAKRAALCDDIAPLAKAVQGLDEAVDVAVAFEQRPVEPGQV